MFGSYHPPNQSDDYYFYEVGKAYDLYNRYYEKVLLTGDFNAEETESCIKSFLSQYNLKNLVRDKTCFKNTDNPSCVNLFLTNSPNSFQHTTTISTGLSDYHKLIVTVLKTSFVKAEAKEILYRNYKNFDNTIFKTELQNKLDSINNCNYLQFETTFMTMLETHAPFKKKIVRANNVPYMSKTLRKAIMKRSALENKYYKNNNHKNQNLYKKQKNYCSRLYKKEKKKLYSNLNHSNKQITTHFGKL